MSSTKCSHCGLVNFSAAVTCKRCNNALSSGDESTVSHSVGEVSARFTDEPAPPRTLGILLSVFGAVLGCAGAYFLSAGVGSPYFLFTGIGILASGVLIAAGKRIGMYLYFATFGMMFIWSIIETGGNAGQLIPRLALPGLIGLYLLSGKVQGRLS